MRKFRGVIVLIALCFITVLVIRLVRISFAAGEEVKARKLMTAIVETNTAVPEAAINMSGLTAAAERKAAEAKTRAEREAAVAKAQVEREAAEQERQRRRNGNAANCNDGRCDWYDAMVYCGGRLPTVAQLQAAYKAECAGVRTGLTCNKWYWSSEESGSRSARDVIFTNGNVNVSYKDSNDNVRCR